MEENSDGPNNQEQAAHPAAAEAEPPLTEEEKVEQIRHYINQLSLIMRPVTLTILLSVFWVKITNPPTPYFNTDFSSSASGGGGGGAQTATPNIGNSLIGSGSGSSNTGSSLEIAGIIAAQIVVATFVIMLLVRYGKMYIVVYVFGFLVSAILGYFGYVLSTSLIATFNFPFDWITLIFLLWNFTLIGISSLFWEGPVKVQQAYLILMSSMMAFNLSSLPDLVTWILLGFLAFWDLFAVLAPFGPLKLLIEAAQTHNVELPAALIYSAFVSFMAVPSEYNAGVGSEGENGLGRSSALDPGRTVDFGTSTSTSPVLVTIPSSSSQKQEVLLAKAEDETSSLHSITGNSVSYLLDHPVVEGETIEMQDMSLRSPPRQPPRDGSGEEEEGDDGDEPHGLKLGLGDFVFYSVLVARASLNDWITTVCTILACLSGLVITIFILVLLQKPLPALPISIFFGILVYIVGSLTLLPLVESLMINQNIQLISGNNGNGALIGGSYGSSFLFL